MHEMFTPLKKEDLTQYPISLANAFCMLCIGIVEYNNGLSLDRFLIHLKKSDMSVLFSNKN